MLVLHQCLMILLSNELSPLVTFIFDYLSWATILHAYCAIIIHYGLHQALAVMY